MNDTSGQKENINTKCSESPRCFSSFSEPEYSCTFSSLSSSCSSSYNLKCEKTQEFQSSQRELNFYFTAPSAGNSEDEQLKGSSCQNHESSELQLEYVAAKAVKQVLNNALNVMDGQSQANTSDCFSESGAQRHCCNGDGSCECKVCWHSADGDSDRLERKREKVQEGKRGNGEEEWFRSRGTVQENVPDICCHGTCCHSSRPGLDEFKEFLRGTPGEKLLNLWLDIERLKSTQNREQKNR